MKKLTLAAASAIALVLGASTLPTMAQPVDFKAHFMEEWDANGDGAITLEEVKERRSSVFDAFDADEDGYLTAPELAMMDEMRNNQHAEMGEQGMGQGMGQGKGMGGQGHGQGMGQGKGMGGQGHGQGMGMGGQGKGAMSFQQTAEQGMNDRAGLDTDGDGKISRAEFEGATGGWFTRLDRNGDNVVNDADF